MAVLALGAVGAGAGALIGGSFLGVSAAAWGWQAGVFAGNYFFGPRPQDQHTEGPRASDTRIVSNAYGEMVPIVFGTYPVQGKAIWASAVREVPNTTTQRVGGKGTRKQTVSNTTYSYFVDVAYLLCEGETGGLLSVKVNGVTKYDVSTGASSQTLAASAILAAALRFYSGSETQEQDPLILAAEGLETPAYRGYSICVIEGWDITEYGGKLPSHVEFLVSRTGSQGDLDVVTVADLGATDSSSYVVLSLNGDIYAGADTSSRANRWNFYSGSKVGTYVPPTFTYNPVGLTIEGYAVAAGFGGGLTVLRPDGTTQAYTGGFAFMGQGSFSNFYSSGLAAESSSVWWARGDSGSSNSFFRIAVNNTAFTLSATQLTGVFCSQMAKNACGIAGRVYMHAAVDGSSQKYVSYVDTGSSSLVQLVALTAISGILVSASGHIWVGPANSTAERKTIRKYDQDGTLLLTVDINNTEGLTSGWHPFEDPAGFIWAIGIESGSNKRAFQIHPTTGLIIARSEHHVGFMLGFTEDGRSVIWDSSTGNVLLKEIERLGRVTGGSYPLDDAVGELLERVGFSSGDYNVSSLSSDDLLGYGIGRVNSLRSIIEPLLPAFRWDLIESDFLLKAVKRTGTVAVTIDEDDLGAYEVGSEPPTKMISTRLVETDLPLEVFVQYQDADNDYEPGTEYDRRLIGASLEPMVMQVPMVMTKTGAKQLAETSLYDRWVSRMLHELTLPRKYGKIDPGDVIGVGDHTLMVREMKSSDGVLSLSCVADRAAVYEPTGIGAGIPAAPTGVTMIGPTLLRLLDIPLLRDVDDGIGFYAVASGYYNGWSGAEIWKSIDGGVTYLRTDSVITQAAPIGSALTVLATWTGGNYFDTVNSFEVLMMNDEELNSSTDELVRAGANRAYCGNGELIGFVDATFISARRYRVSRLLRGVQGTEQHMTTHTIGELFAVLSVDSAIRVSVPSSEIGASRLYKAVTFGQVVTEATPIAFTLSAVGLEPLAPVQVTAGRNAGSNWDILINWMHRPRISGEWRDYVDVPVGEATASYEVDIWDSSFTTLKRTLTSSTETVTYTNAQMTTDFGSSQTTIYIDVYQLSATVARGFAARRTITV